MSLVLHCGGHSVTRNELSLQTIPAALGARHVCRPFIEDVDMISERLDRLGFNITSEAFGLAKQGARFFGVLELEARDTPSNEPFALTVGVRGSYDQSLSRGLAVGSRVFVCDNLAFSGDVTVNTRQTTNIDSRIGQLWDEACDQIPGLAAQQAHRFELYRERRIAPYIGDAAIIELVRRGVVPPSKVGRVVDEWDHPSHDEHLTNGRTVWTLYNAVTEALKPVSEDRFNLPNLWERTVGLTNYFDQALQA